MKEKPSIIKTNRLVLKSIVDDDKNNFINIVSNDEVSLTYMIPTFKNEQEKINLFNKFIELSNKLDRFVYGIYLNDNLIGFVNDVEKNDEEIELGYVIYPLYKNNGYATETLTKCIEVLFDMDYKTIKTGAFTSNIASIKVMQKANMNKTDIIEKITYKDKEHDCIYYIISK